MFHKYYQKRQFEVNFFRTSSVRSFVHQCLTVPYLEQKVTTDRHFKFTEFSPRGRLNLVFIIQKADFCQQ